MSFTCSVCGTKVTKVEPVHRELARCPGCGSNPRFRGIMLAISRHIFGHPNLPAIAQNPRPNLKGIGISDSEIYAKILADKLNYQNTFLHMEPYLDVCDPRALARYSDLDLIVCSDVIEHTKFQPALVLRNLIGLLRPGGFVILSAPTYGMPESIEWYGGAARIDIIERDGKHLVEWSTIKGSQYTDTTPSFHGGPGDTLEMRLISHDQLLEAAKSAGFVPAVLEFNPLAGYEWPIVPEYPGLDAPMDGRVLVLKKPVRTSWRVIRTRLRSLRADANFGIPRAFPAHKH